MGSALPYFVCVVVEDRSHPLRDLYAIVMSVSRRYLGRCTLYGEHESESVFRGMPMRNMASDIRRLGSLISR